MANNYTLTSSYLQIPSGSFHRAKKIVDDVINEIEARDDWVGFDVTVDKDGVWIKHDESASIDHVLELSQALVDGLNISGEFLVQWAFICSKPRIGEFGGGAAVIRKGKEPIIVDAYSEAMRRSVIDRGR